MVKIDTDLGRFHTVLLKVVLVPILLPLEYRAIRKRGARGAAFSYTLNLTTYTCPLLHCILERFCGAELRGARSIDVNRLAGARIAALACRTCLRGEDAEACDRYFVAGLEALNDRVDDRLNSALCIGLGGTKNSVHLVYDVCFVHDKRK